MQTEGKKMNKIENEKDLKMKYVVFKIDDIKEILNITEQQSLWSMLDKIVQYRKTEIDSIISKNKSDRFVKKTTQKMFLYEIKEKLPKQAKQIEEIFNKNGLVLPDD